MKRMWCAVAALLTVTTTVGAQEPRIAGDVAIEVILSQRIDTEKRNVGIVVGVVEPAGHRVISHGTFSVRDPREVDGDTVFEIGSMTKVFTALLLADMAERGEVRFDDPVAKYLPSTVRMPERDGKVITLQDLSTHTSSLPRLPSNLKPANPQNPYADYTVDQLYQFLSGYTLPRPIGVQFEYSNLGAGLLGHALSLKAGRDYESLVRERILAPLKMHDTAIVLTDGQRARLARGHQRLELVENWDLPTLAGAGALRSTARDMTRFLAAFVDAQPHPLTAAIARMRSVERPGAAPNTIAALGWQILKRPDLEIVWHNGGTGGYSSFIGYVPARRVGVVVLSNMQAGGIGVDDVGLHLLDPRVPITRPPVQRQRITLPAAVLGAYVGRYELRPGLVAAVTQEGEQLFVELTNQPRFELFAEGSGAFFAAIVDAQFIFDLDASGRAASVTLRQGGAGIIGKRLPE
jgi:D-alanyl-D-alanine-carboxypeptidase/D-alanyl-D-alanine-endopeptidase